jgi:hypothetical protein
MVLVFKMGIEIGVDFLVMQEANQCGEGDGQSSLPRFRFTKRTRNMTAIIVDTTIQIDQLVNFRKEGDIQVF